MNADGLSRNPNPIEEDLTGATWHGDCDREAVPGWHAVVYLTLMSGSTFVLPEQGSDEESHRAQVVSDVGEDLAVLHKFNKGHFFHLSLLWNEIELVTEYRGSVGITAGYFVCGQMQLCA